MVIAKSVILFYMRYLPFFHLNFQVEAVTIFLHKIKVAPDLKKTYSERCLHADDDAKKDLGRYLCYFFT